VSGAWARRSHVHEYLSQLNRIRQVTTENLELFGSVYLCQGSCHRRDESVVVKSGDSVAAEMMAPTRGRIFLSAGCTSSSESSPAAVAGAATTVAIWPVGIYTFLHTRSVTFMSLPRRSFKKNRARTHSRDQSAQDLGGRAPQRAKGALL
jgi:hypothetical protein